MSNLSTLAAKYSELRTQKDALNSSLKGIQSELDSLEKEILEEMSHEDMRRFDIPNIGSFTVSSRRFFKIEQKEAFMDFIHEQGDTDLLTVQHQTLNAYAKELCARKEAEGIENFVIPGVAYVDKPGIRLKRAGNQSQGDED